MREDRLLMASGAAQLLNRSAATVRFYERSGRLPAIRAANGTRLFRESDVLRLAAELAARARERGISTVLA